MYRVNFNNGQVHGPFPTAKAAQAYIDALEEPRSSYVEFRDADTLEWFRYRKS